MLSTISQLLQCLMPILITQVQPKLLTDIPLTERQRLRDNHLSVSLKFFNLSPGVGPNERTSIFSGHMSHYICLYLGLNPGPVFSKVSILPTRLRWQRTKGQGLGHSHGDAIFFLNWTI